MFLKWARTSAPDDKEAGVQQQLKQSEPILPPVIKHFSPNNKDFFFEWHLIKGPTFIIYLNVVKSHPGKVILKELN